MATDVGQRVNFLVIAARNDDRFASHIEEKEIAGSPPPSHMACKQPERKHGVLKVLLKDALIAIEGLQQRVVRGLLSHQLIDQRVF